MTRKQINTLKNRMLKAITTPVPSDFDEETQCESIRVIWTVMEGGVITIHDIIEFKVLGCLYANGDPKEHITCNFHYNAGVRYTVEPVSNCSR